MMVVLPARSSPTRELLLKRHAVERYRLKQRGKMTTRSTKMIATNDLIAKKLVNALIPNAEPRAPVPNQAVISRFQKHYGVLWGAGTLYLKGAAIEFHPNALNRVLHPGDLCRVITLQDIVDVKTGFGVVTGISDITCTNASTFTFRCFSAKRFAERIREQPVRR